MKKMTRKEILENKANEVKNWDKKEVEELYILLIELQYLVGSDNEKRGWNGRTTRMHDFIIFHDDLPTARNDIQNHEVWAVDEKDDCLFGSGDWMKNYHIKSLKSLS